MTILGRLSGTRAFGRVGKKVAGAVVSITGTGAVTTGLSEVDDAQATVVDSGSTIPTRSASVTSVSGGTVNVVVTQHDASANSVAGSASNVDVIAVGS